MELPPGLPDLGCINLLAMLACKQVHGHLAALGPLAKDGSNCFSCDSSLCSGNVSSHSVFVESWGKGGLRLILLCQTSLEKP